MLNTLRSGKNLTWQLLIIVVWQLLFAPSAFAAGTQFEEINGIRQQVLQYIDQHDFGSPNPVTVQLGKIDPRLRLRQCGTPLDIGFTGNTDKPGRAFVTVACNGETPWNIYVSAVIDMHAEILIASKPLVRGQIISSDDVTHTNRKLSRLHGGYFTQTGQVQGMQLIRQINAGEVLRPALLRPRALVRRGQQVTLIATIGNIQVRMRGKALADAANNKIVRVKNSSSGRIVEGLVSGEGLVKISM